jgi:hypothetical protein
MAVGIALILLSQLVAAGQLWIDQSSWNARLQLSPLKIVGCEGLLGTLLTVRLAADAKLAYCFARSLSRNQTAEN